MHKDKEIGGFLNLDFNCKGKIFHDNSVAVNTGRNAFEYILRANKYSKIYLPYYTCEVLLEPIKKLNLEYSFYSIDEKLFPIFDFSKLKENEGFLYTNYFGLYNENIKQLYLKSDKLIIDNAQAFFQKLSVNSPTFYSPRKFFGVPDGGFVYNNNKLNMILNSDISFNRFDHLLGRTEQNASKFYLEFQNNEKKLCRQPIKAMSKLTKMILSSIDFENVSQIRQQNFNILHNKFKNQNQLSIPNLKNQVPLCYPLLIENGSRIKQQLIKKKIYIPTYWPNVLKWAKAESFEYDLVKNLVCLPIDQRYGVDEMNIILENV